MKRLTTEDFIRRATEVHGDKYDYSKVNYIHAKEPVVIICKTHGEFEQRPNGHLYQNAGCPACAVDSYVRPTTGTKVCVKCGVEKSVDDYYWVNRDRPNGGSPHSYCRECMAKKGRRLNHNNPENYMWKAAKSRAKRQGVPFDISVEDIEIPKRCPVLGIKLKMGHGQPTDNSPSLDRIIPALGYVKGNIEVISHRANSIKRDATPEELRMIADYYNG